MANPNDGIPATWTVVRTFTNPSDSVTLECADYGNAVFLDNTKTTGIRVDSVTNQAG